MARKLLHKLGALKDPRDPRDYILSKLVHKMAPPPVVDYESFLPPIRDQYERGACVAFASCAVKEYQELKQRPKVSKKSFDLSEEFIYGNIRQKGGGAFPRDAFRFLTDKGVCKENLLPYESKISGRLRTDEDDDALDKNGWLPKNYAKARVNARTYRAKAYARCMGTNSMIQAISTIGPILIGMAWLDGWMSPGNNKKINGYPVLDLGQGPKVGGHALCVCGYDAVQQVFKIRNSWSKEWGKEGYAYVTFKAMEKLCDDAWSTIDLDSPLTIKKEVAKAAIKAA